MRILTPTENKRFNELIGFVGLSLAVLLALSLLSYSPHDPSFNVSAPASRLRPGAKLDRSCRRAHGRSVLPALRLRGVSVSRRNVSGGDALVPQPGAGSARSRKSSAGPCWSLPFSAELTLIHMPEVRGALPAGRPARHAARGGIARGVQSGGRESGVDRHVAHRAVSDHQLFVPRAAATG